MSTKSNKEKKKFSAKTFFKSTAFKCIVVLLVIALISGILLTICNTLFYVSAEEKLQRAIGKIYGTDVTATEIALEEQGLETSYDNGTVNSAYYIEETGDYLVNVTGTGGYSGGTVTCWVVVNISDGAISGIGNVVIDSNSGQSYISKVNKDSVLGSFSDNFSEDENYSAWVGTGATFSLTAIVNCVNTSITFVKSEILGETITDPYENFEYTRYINKDRTTYSVDGASVTYDITTSSYGDAGAFNIKITVGSDKTITSYEIVTNGSTEGYESSMSEYVKNGTLFEGKNLTEVLALLGNDDGSFSKSDIDKNVGTGASYSHYVCIYAALFALSNYELCTGGAS